MNIAVILAAGVGQRMRNSGLPKQFLKLMGKPVVIYMLEKIERPLVDFATIHENIRIAGQYGCAVTMAWIEELRCFCEKNPDIQKVYCVDFLCKKQLLIIVDDMASDNVLDYNGFAFGLRNKYKEIKDFMVIDRESYNCFKNEFEKCEEVYRKGMVTSDKLYELA